MKNRVLFIVAALATLALALFAKFGMPAAPASFIIDPQSIMLALIAVAAVAAVLAAAYHPPLFSWRMCTGTPFDDSHISFMAGKGSGGKGKSKGKGCGGGKKK